MLTVIDLDTELGRLKMLQGRTPQTTRAEREGTAAEVAPFGNGSIFTTKFAGLGAWERHPNGDELVQIIAGAAELEIITADGPRSLTVRAGTLAVVPKGAWHRFRSADGVTVMTATPLPTEHVREDVADPRPLAP